MIIKRTVKRLANKVPSKEAIKKALEIDGVYDGISEKYYCYKAYLNRLKSAKEKESDFLVLCVNYQEFDSVVPQAVLYSISEIEAVFKRNEAFDEENALLPQTYSYVNCSADDVASFKIEERNARRSGEATLLGALLYEAAFFGFDEDIAAEGKRLMEKGAEIKLSLKKKKKQKYKGALLEHAHNSLAEYNALKSIIDNY